MIASRTKVIAIVRRVLPRAFARSCLGNSPCIGGFRGFRQPATAERLIKADNGLQSREPRLCQRILSLEQRLLNLQQSDEIDGARLQLLVGQSVRPAAAG